MKTLVWYINQRGKVEFLCEMPTKPGQHKDEFVAILDLANVVNLHEATKYAINDTYEEVDEITREIVEGFEDDE